MDIFQHLFKAIMAMVPTGVAIAAIIVVLFLARWFISRQYGAEPGHRLRRQLVTMLIAFAGLIAVILVLPIGDTRQGQLIGLIGILFSAVIALSSATFMGNMLAGLMLRMMRNFKPGNFIRVGEYFGRVSDRGLFHIEIQCEDRDLITLPNMYLVTHPVKVIQSTGTIVKADISLGYDIPRELIKGLLLEAAGAAKLNDPFVQVMELGDFAVSYRVAGLLHEVKNLISTKSRLREQILDMLHRAGVEIVSPTFMNTRAIQPGVRFIPTEQPVAKPVTTMETAPEAVAFDKADEAETIENLREKHKILGKEIESAKESAANATEATDKERLKDELQALERRRERLGEYLKQREEQEKK